MRCDEVRGQLAEYSIGGLGRRARVETAAHVESCEGCRGELAALTRTGELVSRLGLESAPRGAWDSVRYRIAERGRPVARGAWGRGLAIAGLALAVLMVAAVTFLPGLKHEPTEAGLAQVDAEMQVSMEGYLAATWSAPLADVAVVGWELETPEEES